MLREGTIENPYIIENETDLKNMKNKPRANYKLIRDIDLGGQIWTDSFTFEGSINGNGHTISNFELNNIGEDSSCFWSFTLNFPYNLDYLIQENLEMKIKNINFTNFSLKVYDFDIGSRVSLFDDIYIRKLENINIENVYIESQDSYSQIQIMAFKIIGSDIKNLNIKKIRTNNSQNSYYQIFHEIRSYTSSKGILNTNINNIFIEDVEGYIGKGFFGQIVGGFHYSTFPKEERDSKTNISNVLFKDFEIKNNQTNMNIFSGSIRNNTNINKIAFKNISFNSNYTMGGGCHFSTFGKELKASNFSIQDVYWKDIKIKGSISGAINRYYKRSGLICGVLGGGEEQKNVNIKNMYFVDFDFENMPAVLISVIKENIDNFEFENIYMSDKLYQNTDGTHVMPFEYVDIKYYEESLTLLKSAEEAMKFKENYVGFDFKNIWGIDLLFNNGFPYLKEIEEYEPVIGKIQFVGEKLIDMINMLAETLGKKININNEGKFELINRRNIDNLDPDYIYENPNNIEWYDAEWNDTKIVSQVKVTGRNVSAPRQVIERQKLLIDEKIILPAGEDSRTVSFSYGENNMRAVNIGWEWKAPDDDEWKYSFFGEDDYAKIVAINPYEIIMYFRNHRHSGTDGEFYVKVWGNPVAEIPPGQIEGIAVNSRLMSIYGTIEKTIDNPLLQSFKMVQEKAEEELFFNNIQTKKIKVKLLSDVRIQPGKVVSVYHPVYQSQIKLYVSEVSHRSERGSEDSTTITGFVL